MNFPYEIFYSEKNPVSEFEVWDTHAVHQLLSNKGEKKSLRSTERLLSVSGLLPDVVQLGELLDEHDKPPRGQVISSLASIAKKKRDLSLIVQAHSHAEMGIVLFANDGRAGRRWLFLKEFPESRDLEAALKALSGGRNTILWPHGEITAVFRNLAQEKKSHELVCETGNKIVLGVSAYQPANGDDSYTQRTNTSISSKEPIVSESIQWLSHLDKLEAESIHIMREVVAQAENPVMLYSVGKDSSVMLHLAKKAFYPSPPPFPLMHVDTRWKFQEMYQFRDQAVAECGMDLIVHINPEGVEKNINPFDHGSALHTDVMKTEGLKQALDKHRFDVAFGGARRDEEKSRAKERVFSFRTNSHRWDPKNQRPELWNLYNGYKAKGDSIRVFPLSNWTELDIWQYIYRESIPIVPLYYAAERPVVERDGMLIMVDDDRMKLHEDEKIKIKQVRFRTLGCYPLTGAVESDADDLSSIVLELLQSRTSERQGRAIDSDSSGSMEKKKQEGYF